MAKKRQKEIMRIVYLILCYDNPLVAFSEEKKAKEELKNRKEKFKEFEFKIETLVVYDEIELIEKCLKRK